MPPPAVSVILPAYNAAATLGFAVQSVRRQTWRDWELIVVDDGSRDGTAELAQELARLEGRLRLIRQPNRGVSAARNAGIEAARGRYLAFLDADDLWLPRKLARQLEFMRRIGSPFSATAYRRQWGARLGPVFHVPRLITYETSLKSRPFISITVMADREQVRVRMPDIGRSSRIPEDLVAWLAILRTGVVAHGLDEDLARYRMVQGSRSANKLACAYQVWRVYRDFERLDVPSASWYFAHYAVRSVGTRVPWLWTT
ncbi:MAG TPA: glycosyltransferase family 2 protein [Burkholderiales bacterium]|nr:glycosyltransferase family 2 protein [Burkholderiales bacterium]